MTFIDIYDTLVWKYRFGLITWEVFFERLEALLGKEE